MKRLCTFLLALVYLGTSIGATVHMHYCMGKLANWSLSASNADNCAKCGMPYTYVIGKHCCTDEQKTIGTNGDQKAAEALFQFNGFSVSELPAAFSNIPDYLFITVIEEISVPNGPPLGREIPIYIRNCVFRI